ncbi:MAG: response regulator [Lachnospiraceae bacterium]|nr:response regulator [Lachnospiraceae bacterium]
MIHMLVIGDKRFHEGTHILTNAEYQTTVAGTAIKAFSDIIRIQPDIIILNMLNPAYDGLDVLQRIRNMRAGRDIPLIALVNDNNRAEVMDKALKTEGLTETVDYEEGIEVWTELCLELLHIDREAPRKRILVVDDDPIVLGTTELYLGAHYDVIVKSTAYDAVRFLNESKPDLIILDIAMPGTDGLTLAEKIRQMNECKELPILFQTGMASGNTIQKSMLLNPAGYMIKPMKKDVLLRKLQEIFKGEKKMFRKVLYVDDRVANLRTLKGILGEKYDFIEISLGSRMEEELQENDADAIIVNMDCAVQRMEAIRRKSLFSMIPVILVSKNLETKEIQKELKEPLTYALQEPFLKEEVIATFEAIR